MFGCLIPKSYKEGLEFDKEITTPNGLMEPGMKWIASRNKKSSSLVKGPNGIQTTNESLMHLPTPKNQGKLDI